MSSNINPNNIDGTFPIAGQDNSSQGFRDNFTNIRNNFSYAQSEISDLQNNALVLSPLIGEQAVVNNMNYNPIQNAQLLAPGYSLLNLQSPSSGSSVVVSFSAASVQKITTPSSVGYYNISFSNWPPTGIYGEVLLWVSVQVSLFTLNFSGITSGLSDIAGASAANQSVTFDMPGEYVLKFRTVDNGTHISMSDLSRNYGTLHDFNLYYNPAVTPTLLVGYGQNVNSFETILALETGQDAVSAYGSYNSVTVGNLGLGSIQHQFTDTGPMGGFSVSATRGNIANVQYTPVSSGDFLGYVNSITYTGSISPGNPNQFQQVASMGFYATGSNVISGLGGNIAMFTHQPATTGNILSQVIGFENDQSTHYYGNMILTATNGTGTGTSSYVPAHYNSAGTAGQMAWDQGNVYVCTSTNTWKKIQYTSTSW